MHNIRLISVMSLMILAILSLVACGGVEEGAVHNEPYHLEDTSDPDFKLVVLTEKAAERLDIQSEEVAEAAVDGGTMLSVPYSAVIYGLNGETFVYTRNPGPDSLEFLRVPIAIDRIDGGRAYLAEGPDTGTHVLTRGVAEVYGAETGVGK